MTVDSLPITAPVVDALRQGRARIENGWCQCYAALITKEREAYCAIGALSEDADARHLLARALNVEQQYDITAWNDAPERTQAEVLALYDKAIDLAIAEAMAG